MLALSRYSRPNERAEMTNRRTTPARTRLMMKVSMLRSKSQGVRRVRPARSGVGRAGVACLGLRDEVVEGRVGVRRKHLDGRVRVRRDAALHPEERGEPGLLDDVRVELLGR